MKLSEKDHDKLLGIKEEMDVFKESYEYHELPGWVEDMDWLIKKLETVTD